ncbi:MAG: SDR family NAD(P)-dependent oxidoreductase [Taibaiella sp.]|nr:SDR family NAD(P)-dependent oxidoreductase [Taibaiella sp.]
MLLYGFKAYKGIVRYTTFEDTGRILLINFLVCVLLNVLEYVYSRTIHQQGTLILPFNNLVIYFFAVSFFQILYRLGVKRVFSYLFVNKRKKDKAVIFNARNEGRLVGKMISDNPMSSLKIIAYLEDNPKVIGKKIENIPVVRMSYNNLERLKKENVNLVIIADPYIRKSVLNEIVDLCLDLDIRVQQVPSTEKWINNQLDVGQLKDIKIEQLLEREEINLNNERVATDIKGKKVVITGAAGSIGSEIVRQVLALNPTIVIAIDNAETPLHNLKLSIEDSRNLSKIIYFVGDICDRIRMEQVFEIYQPDIVYHAAAYKHVPLMEESPSIAVRNNVLGTKNLAELSVEYGVDKFVMVSTDKAVNPTNVMGASKRIAEIFTQSYFTSLKKKYEKKEIQYSDQVYHHQVWECIGIEWFSDSKVYPAVKGRGTDYGNRP